MDKTMRPKHRCREAPERENLFALWCVGAGMVAGWPPFFLRTKRQREGTGYKWEPGKGRKGYLERKWPGIREEVGRVAAHTENISKGREPRRGFENSCI